jgi:hypothetical protein
MSSNAVNENETTKCANSLDVLWFKFRGLSNELSTASLQSSAGNMDNKLHGKNVGLNNPGYASTIFKRNVCLFY